MQVWSDGVAQGCVQLSFKYIQEWKSHTSPGFSSSVSLPSWWKLFLFYLVEVSHVPACVCCFFSHSCPALGRVWLHFPYILPLSSCRQQSGLPSAFYSESWTKPVPFSQKEGVHWFNSSSSSIFQILSLQMNIWGHCTTNEYKGMDTDAIHMELEEIFNKFF